MKIVVLSGSPKGPLSATLQYARFLEKQFPEHDFHVAHVALEEGSLEEYPWALESVVKEVRGAQGVLWVFPIYTFLVPARYKMFIERLLAGEAEHAFRDKYAASLSTSIHFFDHTAHNYVHGICEDLGMSFVGSFSAGVYDLIKPEGKRQLTLFARDFFAAISDGAPVARRFVPLRHRPIGYSPGPPAEPVDLDGKRMVIVTDAPDEDANASKMVERLRSRFRPAPEVVNLRALAIRFGCDGCFQCGANGLCVRRDADDLHALYTSKLDPADVIVMAGTIQDRYLSSRWKLFFDRGFFRPLVPWFPGKQLAFLVSGPLRQLPNLREILEAYSEFHQANLAGIVTDEATDSATLDRLLDGLAERLALCAGEGYVKPRSFLGIGGSRIFRDDTYGFLRPVFQFAHRYYRKHGLYDFPQNDLRTRLMVFGGMLMTKLPGVGKRFYRSLKKDIVRCLQKEVENWKGE
jgi:multimeric flavodoxin WrbA